MRRREAKRAGSLPQGSWTERVASQSSDCLGTSSRHRSVWVWRKTTTARTRNTTYLIIFKQITTICEAHGAARKALSWRKKKLEHTNNESKKQLHTQKKKQFQNKEKVRKKTINVVVIAIVVECDSFTMDLPHISLVLHSEAFSDAREQQKDVIVSVLSPRCGAREQ